MYEADKAYIHTPIVPGIECVGVVEDPSDSSLQRGDSVMAMMGGMGRSFNGSYCEYALLPTANVFKVESSLDWTSLAAIPETYFTAYGSLTECLLLQPNDRLLVRGATSSVGQAAIQLAKAMGVVVVATCRNSSSFDSLKAIGADECVVDDGCLCDKSIANRPNKVLELVGPKTLADSMLVVTRPGYVCDTGILGNVYALQQFDPIKQIPNGVFLSGFYSNYPTQENVDAMMAIINNNGIKPLYSKVYTLDEIANAHALLERGGAGGKIVLTVNPEDE
jgi:NADPH:quinone reductase-like Zn-dependent oxidoreductase